MAIDILAKLPIEIAFHILGKLDIKDLATCQGVSRKWYWMTVDQAIWKEAFFAHEQPYAIPRSIPDPSFASSSEHSSSSSTVTTSTISLTGQQHKDWKKACRSRVISDRNWKNGDIQSLLTLRYHQGGIVRLRIKGGKLLSGDMFGQVAVWDTKTFTCEHVLEAAVGPIRLLDFSAKAMVMTVISKSGVCRVWDIKTKRLISSFNAHNVTCMTMNDTYLVVGMHNGQVDVVDFWTCSILRSTEPFSDETLQDIYIQNNTVIIATDRKLRIVSLDTMEILMSCPLPRDDTVRTFCSVFHIRSLILLTEQYLLQLEWEPLYRSPNKKFEVDGTKELPPNLDKPPQMQRTKVPPIATITSIAIGGNHPRVLTTNADRPSLNGTIRLCPAPTPAVRKGRQDKDRSKKDEMDEEKFEKDEEEDGAEGHLTKGDEMGIVLSSRVPEVAEYLETCGLKPSFMDVDEDVIVIGTSKGDVVVLNMMPQE
ncbi:hypothetical protein BGZ94_001885 [Podila epigama]|nr:hypothetical protein BGZ94_001885 [Podila epigama]